MGKISFYITGLSRKTIRKRVRRAHPGISGSPLVLLVAAGIGGMVILDKTLPDFISLLSGTKIVNIGCAPVFVQELALVVDNSPSMNTPERQAILNTQIKKRMRENDVSTSMHDVFGMGTADDNSDNLLKKLREISSSRGGRLPDTIICLSDFESFNASDPEKEPFESWETTSEGYTKLNEILTRNNVRLYLGSVKHLPSLVMPGLLSIAERSGGGEIYLTVHEDGKSPCY